MTITAIVTGKSAAISGRCSNVTVVMMYIACDSVRWPACAAAATAIDYARDVCKRDPPLHPFIVTLRR